MNKKQTITVCALIVKNNKLFIAKRADTKKFLPGKYELVGGHVEYGEAIQEALIREVKEELRIEIEVNDPCYAFTYLYNNEHVVEIDYLAKMKNNNQKIILNPSDHSEYKWIGEKEIDNYFSSDNEEKQALIKAFKII